VCSALHACKQREHDIKFSKAKEAVANANKKEYYVQVSSSERKKNKGNPGEGIPAASESLGAAKLGLQKSQTGCRSHAAHR
jgi:hypothetical protein